MPPLGTLFLVLVMGLPLLWLIGGALISLGGADSGVTATMLPIALKETGILMLSVGLLAGILGLAAAWIVRPLRFPRCGASSTGADPAAGGADLSRGLLLHRIPRFHRTGPAIAPGAHRRRDHQGLLVPEIRSNAGAALVMSLVLYPYVYLSCRAFFLMQSGSVTSAARALGANGWRTFFAIVLPLSRAGADRRRHPRHDGSRQRSRRPCNISASTASPR